jgi:tagatose 1,6-diphosphate aldolase
MKSLCPLVRKSSQGAFINKFDLAFFLEPLSYSLDPNNKLTSAEKRDVVVRTAEKLTPLGVDVLKAEFPLNIKEDGNEANWAEACREVSQASRVPWVLLSAGVDFSDYLKQLVVACQSGASGAMAGRAVWKEAVGLQGDTLINFLRDIAVIRMSRLSSLCEALGKSWKDYYSSQKAPDGWYQTYQDI